MFLEAAQKVLLTGTLGPREVKRLAQHSPAVSSEETRLENHKIGSPVSLGTGLLQWCGKLKPALLRCLVLIAREEMVGERNKGIGDIMGFRVA